MIIFALLAEAELRNQVLLIVILEIAFVLAHTLKFEKLREHFSSLELFSGSVVQLASLLQLFAVDLEDLFVSVAESHHFLPGVVVQRTVKSLEIFDLGVRLILFTNERSTLPSALSVG